MYRKALRKPPEAYTTTTPPHVAVARKTGPARRGRIAYVITTAGPQPAEAPPDPLDYEHYLDKQVRAVAEPVLTLLGLDLDRHPRRRRSSSACSERARVPGGA